MIGKGTTRTVVVLGPIALKFARSERGRRCNRFEADLYRRVCERRRAMLCPILWCAPLAIVVAMATAKPLTEAERDQLWETDGFPDWDCMPPNDDGEPFEWKPSDWGQLDGRLVALDYSAPAL